MKGLLLLLLFGVVAIGLPVLFVLALLLDYRITRQMKIDLAEDFSRTLEEFRIGSYEVLAEQISHGHARRVSEVYRIFVDDTGQYYFYQYVPGSRGILKPLSRERALLAAGTDGLLRA
ncbi:hypothetical protein N5J43_24835 [Pseudomonas nicosulfuronedens]|uniref:Uncharacterized protein n=1 Tax=Pseudomonas nicosulfuronedens TaxID=2571105 RepID=A0A5R9R011_9PSED|nr:hypothetical protein [Pseudomonas nicosulfuronedens]MDH1012929.1 hypothetical protein [Pseudomonas nicosulfuronedens]MDH1982193.1 hypothetical protein [Pseudomonas nicosulfuronedens]MDH2030694.1 hypothetical protein [Pseudomonas nicosulfuronedens]TLX75819.1 hypothetical protein FAS41_15520 [Pseudomonas nicosulfuronedens]